MTPVLAIRLTTDALQVPEWVEGIIAPDKNWRQLGICPPLFGLMGYFKF